MFELHALRGYLDHLMRVEGEIESKSNLFRLYNYVKALLPDSDTNVMLAASKTLGQIAGISGAAFGGDYFMDFEVQAAVALLQSDKHEFARHAGVLILKELARNSQAYFHSHVGALFDRLIITPVAEREGVTESGLLVSAFW